LKPFSPFCFSLPFFFPFFFFFSFSFSFFFFPFFFFLFTFFSLSFSWRARGPPYLLFFSFRKGGRDFLFFLFSFFLFFFLIFVLVFSGLGAPVGITVLFFAPEGGGPINRFRKRLLSSMQAAKERD